MKRLLLISALLLCTIVQAQDYDTYLAKASAAIENGNRRDALENATKALEINPNSNDARFIKVRASLNQQSDEATLRNCLKDLYLIVNSGGSTARVNNAIGIVESELGSYIYRFKKAKKPEGITDDLTGYISEQNNYFKEAIAHYESAKSAYQKAAEINPDEKATYQYKIKDAERYIAEIKAKIKS